MACGISDIPELGIRELMFENGVKVILKPVFTTDKIYLKGFSPGTNSLNKNDEELAKKYSTGDIPVRLNNISAVQLNKFYSKSKYRFSFRLVNNLPVLRRRPAGKSWKL